MSAAVAIQIRPEAPIEQALLIEEPQVVYRGRCYHLLTTCRGLCCSICKVRHLWNVCADRLYVNRDVAKVAVVGCVLIVSSILWFSLSPYRNEDENKKAYLGVGMGLLLPGFFSLIFTTFGLRSCQYD